MGTMEEYEQDEQESSVVDYIDELQHLLGKAPWSREARSALRQILAEAQEEHQQLQQKPDDGQEMTVRQCGYLEALDRDLIGERTSTRKEAAGYLVEALGAGDVPARGAHRVGRRWERMI